MSGPNESPLNVRLIEQIKLIYQNLKALFDQVEHATDGDIIGNKTYLVGQSPPDPVLGDDGDSALFEDDDSWQVWYKTLGAWALIGKEGGLLIVLQNPDMSSVSSIEVEHEVEAG